MGKIAKAYSTIFVDGNVLTASDTRRAFSDAYELVNGNLNSANFISININTVVFDTSSFESTGIINVIQDSVNQNFHNFHFFPNQDKLITIYRGRGMVKGAMQYINNDFVITASNHLLSGTDIVTGCFAILIGQGLSNVITASDIFLQLTSEISASLAWNDQYQGYYPSIASANRRYVFSTLNFFSACSKMADGMFIDAPHGNHYTKLTAQEASSIGFTGVGQTTNMTASLNGFRHCSVHRFYDHETNAYGLWHYGRTQFVTGNAVLNGQLTENSIQNAFTISDFNFVNDNTCQTWGQNRAILNSAGTLLGNVTLKWQNQVSIRIGTTALSGAYYSFKMTRLPLFYRTEGNRG